ncbi:Holliday junction DNA helicase RuvA [Spiroplasma gladiatoris]|uniref:Holliday junction DNA helicase RuvA n=1 Tax=Spiroplasma gladiatoris TaxID=2143 RepID=A0A4V1AQ91_9MOLU|nr:hypothetical protein [Spiroplasma gladiatoris]QBQ07679.1 Holliday junction DNA helicase RuvA [Spiroplasma gladiatoris]
MYYLNAKVIEVYNNEVLVEVNNIGYKGIIVSKNIKDIKVGKNQKIYFYNYRNEYTDEYLFFINEQILNLAKTLLQIKFFGIKTLLALFYSLDYEELIEAVKSKHYDLIKEKTSIKESLVKEIFVIVGSKVLNIKYNKKQMEVINSLHKLGYKFSSIYQAISQVDDKLDEELLFKNTLVKLNEIKC